MDEPSSTDYRRILVLVAAIALLVTCAVITWGFGASGSAEFAAAATGRMGLMMMALWLAWPSLRRPASWLPPGFAMAGVIALAILAARPRLIVVAVPALGVLLALTAIIRTMRR